MTKNKSQNQWNFFILFIFILVCISIWALTGIFAEKETQEVVRISVILNENSNPRWIFFQQGLEQASKDYDVDLSLVPTPHFESGEDLKSLIEQRSQDGSHGIILTPYEAEGISSLREQVGGDVNLLFVENDMKRDETSLDAITVVAPNYKEMAKGIIAMMEEDFSGSLAQKNVALLTSNPYLLGSQQAMEVLQEDLENKGAKVLNMIPVYSESDIKKIHLRSLDLIIALDDSSLYYLAKEASQGNNHHYSIYGIGSSKMNVYYLDQKVISGMIVCNDFKMGYESIVSLCDQIRNHNQEAHGIEIEFHSVRPADVHDPDFEKILYPISQ